MLHSITKRAKTKRPKTKNRELSCLVLFVLVAGCSKTADQIGTEVTEPLASQRQQPVSLDARTMQLWSHSCALCHVDGTAGAPRLGHSEEWLPRLAKGDVVLLKHTLEGFNDMPPLGYCMACESEQFVAMIHFMSGGNAAMEVQ